MSATEPVEIEVKLAVDRSRVVARLLRDPNPARLAGFSADGDAHLVHVADQYLDTAPVGGRLLARGMRARLRHSGSRVVLAVKRAGVERDGVTTRVEIQAPATRSLRPERWPASDARSALLKALTGAPLVEIARLRQRRLIRVVRRDATRVELSLDRLEAVHGGRILASRYELEAELLDGDERALAELARALAEIDGVGPPLGSKLWFALEARAER